MRTRPSIAIALLAALSGACGGAPARPAAPAPGPSPAPCAPSPPPAPSPADDARPLDRPAPRPVATYRQETELARAPAPPRAIEPWLAGLEADAARVCACADRACADRVFTDGAGLGLPKGALAADQQARVDAAMQRLAACHAALAGQPPRAQGER